eukprot:CAMPEP_0178999084 /NCGR_PEP_ID=MMETSP0795-20121207/9859_1 /TAXON_ID=88552 /ORGANISM="Amoebophrya sp., Strain Ameob2" /LENGTH=867 /DNA_ID=CAMNT_0020691809 /DNA_START=98 /DNA_END=2701 /DNA_ORIENTATION=+
MIGAANFLERLEAEAVPIVDVREKLPDKKISISVDLSSVDTAEPSRDHSSAEFATTSVSEDETRPLSASLARHRALLEQVSNERKEHNLHLLNEQKRALRKEAAEQEAAQSAAQAPIKPLQNEQASATRTSAAAAAAVPVQPAGDSSQRGPPPAITQPRMISSNQPATSKPATSTMRSTLRNSMTDFSALLQEAEEAAELISPPPELQQPAPGGPTAAQQQQQRERDQKHRSMGMASSMSSSMHSSTEDQILHQIQMNHGATIGEFGAALGQGNQPGHQAHTWSNFAEQSPAHNQINGPAVSPGGVHMLPAGPHHHRPHFQHGGATSSSTEIMTTTNNSPAFDQILLAQSVENANLKKMLSTPRTLQACKELGIVPSELHIKQLQDFAKVNDPSKDTMKMRFQHFEGKRQEKLRLVLEARSKIIAREFENLGGVDGSGAGNNFYSLQLMEDILDQEAKRLAKKLKQEVRLHAAVEKENEEQLLREKQVKERGKVRDLRRQLAEQKRMEEALKTKSTNESRLEQTKSVRTSLEEYEKARQAQILAVQFEDEIRVREFQKEKEVVREVKNEHWKDKVEFIAQRQLEAQLEKEIKAEQSALRYDDKLQLFEARRLEEQKQQMVRHETEHLKIVDAVERRGRLQRIDQHRRDKVGEQLVEQQTRIHSLMQLKQQLLEQRRQRSRLQDAKNNSVKGLNIRHIEPGPGQYDIPNTLNQQGVGKIPDPKPLKPVEGSIAAQVARAKEMPPPGSYDPRLLPGGGKVLADRNITFGSRHSGYADDVLKRKRDLPGPGTYNVSGNFKLNHVANMGKMADVASTFDHGQIPRWVGKIDRDTPGPGSYAVDEYTRRERTAKVMSTMPTFMTSALPMAKK